jgi:hypothetical protein
MLGGAKSKYAKINKSCSLKSCGHSLETTFILQISKTLSADDRASASKIEKIKHFGDFFKN